MAACVLFYGGFAVGDLPVGQDNSLMYCPFYSLHWDQGLPLWNPYSLSGSGLYDNLQAALLYPMRWPFYFLADWRSYFGIFNFLHYLVAFAGSALFLRTLGTARVSAVAGSVLFAAGGHLAGRIINPTIFYGCCWLPLLLCGAAGTRRRHGWAATFAMTMILTIGSPHLILYGLVGFFLVFLIVALPAGKQAGETEKQALGFRLEAVGTEIETPTASKEPQVSSLKPQALREPTAYSLQPTASVFPLVLSRVFHLLVAFVLAAPALIPGIQRAGASIRTQAGAALNLSDSVEWGELAVIFPGGTPAGVHPEYIDKTCYVGSLAIALILFSLLRRASWRDRRFWCGWGLVLTGVVFALGRNIGWHFVMPWIPGFRHLAGPSRALALSAAGAAVLLALALESLPRRRIAPLGAVFLAVAALCFAAAALLAWRMPVAEGAPPFLDEWLRAWAVAPRTVRGPLWLLIDAAAGLALGGLVLLLGARRPRFLVPGLTGLIILQLLHFLPRVAPPVERAAFFDPPTQALFLQKAQDLEPGNPFRVAGVDPLQLYDGDFEKTLKKDFLTPNFATLYGLEDIQGFDPLIHLSYLDLIQRTSGRSPINDPIHNLDIARPDPALFDLLNVRFLIGHPYDRRLTNQSMRLTSQAPIQDVTAWNDAPTSTPLTDLLFVSLMDGATLPQSATAATLTIEAKEGIFSYPVRDGLETSHLTRLNLPQGIEARVCPTAPIHRLWYADSVAPSFNYRVRLANYRGWIHFEKPLTVKKITWRLQDPRTLLYVACQAYRMARLPEAEDPWRLAWGREEDPAPVFEYRNHKDRAALVTEYKPAAPAGREELPAAAPETAEKAPGILIPEETLRSAPSSGVLWLERRTNSLKVRVQTASSALLVLREMWAPGWRATLNGKAQAVVPVNGLWRGVQVPAGTTDIEMTFHPALFYFLLWLSLATLGVVLARFVWLISHNGLQKVYEEGED